MTTNEIKTLIQNTIAGQGSQVDIGGKLAEILSAIVDAMPSGLSDGAIMDVSNIITGDVTVIDYETFKKIDRSAILYDGSRFLPCINVLTPGQEQAFLSVLDNPTYWVFFGGFVVSDSGFDSGSGLLVAGKGNNFYIQKMEI